MRHANETPGWKLFQTYSNIVFSCIFLIEAALKMVAFQPKSYFQVGDGEKWSTLRTLRP